MELFDFRVELRNTSLGHEARPWHLVAMFIRQLYISQSSKTTPLPKHGNGAGLELRVTLDVLTQLASRERAGTPAGWVVRYFLVSAPSLTSVL